MRHTHRLRDACRRLLSSGLCAAPANRKQLDRRLRHWTGSADLPAGPEALAGLDLATPTAGGEFHPALKTFVVSAGNRRGEFNIECRDGRSRGWTVRVASRCFHARSKTLISAEPRLGRSRHARHPGEGRGPATLKQKVSGSRPSPGRRAEMLSQRYGEIGMDASDTLCSQRTRQKINQTPHRRCAIRPRKPQQVNRRTAERPIGQHFDQASLSH